MWALFRQDATNIPPGRRARTLIHFADHGGNGVGLAVNVGKFVDVAVAGTVGVGVAVGGMGVIVSTVVAV